MDGQFIFSDTPIPYSVQDWQKVAFALKMPECHWHFSQGLLALDHNLYIPAVLSMIAGIEASIRFTLYQLDNKKYPEPYEDIGAVFSNSLLSKAGKSGMPISLLAFPGEDHFLEQLGNKKTPVEIISIRNHLAHGNIVPFINRDLGEGMFFFTPECLRSIAFQLKEISLKWAESLGIYREACILGPK
jgi:hypothetical protein